MKAQEFINKTRANGRYSFTIQEAEAALELSKIPVLNALSRLKQHKLIVSPAKGFYLIIPPEYQAYGCLPADMFVPELMKYFNQAYYVGFLSAAQFYGATHQKPQQFQIVTLKKRRPIECGRIRIEFIANKKVSQIPIKKFNTSAGVISVSTPEVIAHDLVSAPRLGAGVNNVVTVLTELAGNIDAQQLINLTTIYSDLFWQQRLGYFFELLGFNQIADVLFKNLANKKLNWVKLISNAPYKNLQRDKKWKIIINTHVESDL